MNSAIDYIENNLDGSVSVTEAAKEAFCSSFHFQRMFFAIIGVTPAEYIRRRRLTLAASELAVGNTKVIDVAMKYGYDSPNAFTRAFRNVHGISPREARNSGVKLSAYDRIFFRVEIRGGNEMDYKIIEKPAFEIIGKCKHFTNENFFKEAPAFWKKYVTTEEYQALWSLTNGKWGQVAEAPLMSVYVPDEVGSRDSFKDILGVEKPAKTKAGKFKVLKVPAATYAEFNCSYHTAVKMHKYIYGEWFPSTNYERDESKPDIAAYFPVAFLPTRGMGVRWWIPVINK
ncbi:AraC family transcriptional regulator [Rubellicoccus peritrichatus]|uniref:AraC family transcriptional regulator n=1 Tax=Rubellicoccus peritrichatus TaxID=3080537 RepID=A0AAQ3LC17_9BACT|nr:AraC family transcriptional regulator [Puniceicoccus sp. CR14]WOO43319.1 AraC family transcriptional regulator [Puniceicoccus sp. CR14]